VVVGFRAEDADSLAASFDALVRETNREVEIDLSFYLLLVAIIIFTILWVLYNLRFKVIP